MRRFEMGIFADDRHTKAVETCNRVMWCNRIDHHVHIILGGSKINFFISNVNAETRIATRIMGGLGDGKQSLGWHAPAIKAITAHLATFKQHHTRTHLHRTCG